jgi:fermentation-respiration switch protein FrsA (DUF1100 family)
MTEETPQKCEPPVVPTKTKMPMTLRRQVKRMIVLLVVAYVALCAFALTCADRVLFQPHAADYRDDAGILKLKTADGVTISAIYLPNPSAKYTILFSHGNAEDLGDVRTDLLSLQQLGFVVLGYDYHGYGTSQGTPSEPNCYRDIDAAYEYLTVTLKTPPERILVFGRSVGGGPSVDLAARKPCGGLILHGRQDAIVPFRHGQQLFAAANDPKRCLWIDGAGHNDFSMVGDPRYDKALQDLANLAENTQK